MRSMRRHVRGAASLAVAGMLALTACGDDGEEPIAGRDGVGETDPDEFRARAGEACDELRSSMVMAVDGLMDRAVDEPASEDTERLALSLADHTDQLLEALGRIGAPEEHADEWTEWIDLLEEDVEAIRDDPAAAFLGGTEPARDERISELTETLGVPACSDLAGTIDEARQARDGQATEAHTEETGRGEAATAPGADEATVARSERMTADIRDEWGDFLTEEEAECLAAGLVDVLPENPAEWEDLDLDQLPADDQAAVLAAFTACVPPEKLLRVGGV